MAFPILEKAGCVWCLENGPCAKVEFRLFCKSLSQRNIPLIFCRGVYALLCLLWVINQVTNPHLFKVKGRNLGPEITLYFQCGHVVWRIYWLLRYNKAYCGSSFLSFLPGVTFPAILLTVLFPQPYERLWSHISLMSCVPQGTVGSEEIVFFLCSQVVCQGESRHLCRSKKKRLTEGFYFLYFLCLPYKSWCEVVLNAWASFKY